MTLIASVDVDGTPVLFADMLVTFKGGPERIQLELPSIGLVSKIEGRRSNIAGLYQKVCIISDFLAVAYAGDVAVAQIVLRGLKRLARDKDLTLSDLDDFYLQRKPYFVDRVALVGVLVERHGSDNAVLSRFFWNGDSALDAGLGIIHYAGSGGALIRAAVEASLITPDSFANFILGQRAVARVLSFCGHVLTQEERTKDPITKYSTGGGWELAYFDGARFVKPEVTFFMWKLPLVDGIAQLGDPTHIIKSIYVDGFHLINCVRQIPELSVDGKDFWQPDLHVVYPIFESLVTPPKYSEPSIIGFQSSLTQHQVSIYEGVNHTMAYSFVELGQSGAFAESSADEFKMVYREDFLSNLVKPLTDLL